MAADDYLNGFSFRFMFRHYKIIITFFFVVVVAIVTII